jgi:nicotinamide-nucleotide amidase
MTEKNNTTELISLLRQTGEKLALAESCTGGLAAARLTQNAGVSDCFCGSAVTYLDDVKIDWLHVDKKSIDTFSAVSEQVAREMVEGVLSATQCATIGAAITGHLGPNSPEGLDGTVFVAFARQNASSTIKVASINLVSPERVPRQSEAAEALFSFLIDQLRP